LNAKEAETLLRLMVRAQNKVKGRAIDFARLAVEEVKGGTDRQFKAFTSEIKNYEQGLRKAMAQSLVDAGLIESFSEYDLSQWK